VGFDIEPTVVDLLTPIVDITSTAQENADVTYWMSDGGSLGSADGSYIFSNGGTFDIVQTVISPFGCTATATAEVVVNGTIFFAPSAFTPDGDGINDFWLPSALGVTEYHMDVYNRWGAVLWTSDDSERPWMGEVNGGTHYVPDGLYLWRVHYRDQVGFRHAETGTVQVIR
jgi:gliding motility-associated-like protein